MLSETTIYPAPEAIQRPDIEGAFEIEEGYTAHTDLAKRKMVVPVGGACTECGIDHARALRLREMGHTAFTPADWEARVKRTKDKLSLSLVARCEDARINARRSREDLEALPATLCESDGEPYFLVRQAIRNNDLSSLAGIIAASYGSGDEEPIKNAITKAIAEMKVKADPAENIRAMGIERLYPSVISHTRYHLFYRRANFRQSLSLARDILNIVGGVESEMEAKMEEERIKKEAAKVKVKGGTTPKRKPNGTNWGALEIVKLPLTRASKAGFERRWTARDEGPIPTRFDRWSIDRRVFRARKKGKGAALLVDVSGSMRWSEEHLAQVLDEVPAATIAIYSGAGSKGQLVIVAKNGRCATMKHAARYQMGGNVVDGPALEWLAEQPESVKLWMSDGGITGVGDGYAGDAAEAHIERTMRKGGIQQVRNADRVLAILSGKEKFTPSRKMLGR